MALSIPAAIEVLGQTFIVRVQPHPTAQLNPDDNDSTDAMGHCDRQRLVISLRGPDGMADDKAREVLLHEVLHAIIGTARIPPFHATTEADDDLEEKIVSMLAPLLLHTLRENPGLVRVILGRDADTRA